MKIFLPWDLLVNASKESVINEVLVNKMGILWNILAKLRAKMQNLSIFVSFFATITNILQRALKKSPSIPRIVVNINKALKVCWWAQQSEDQLVSAQWACFISTQEGGGEKNLIEVQETYREREKWCFSFSISCRKPLVSVWLCLNANLAILQWVVVKFCFLKAYMHVFSRDSVVT